MGHRTQPTCNLAPAKEQVELAKAEIKRRRRERAPDETPEPNPITPGSMYLRGLEDKGLVLDYRLALKDLYREFYEERRFQATMEEI